MIVSNPDNAGLTPVLKISLSILSNNLSVLTAVSFAAVPFRWEAAPTGHPEFEGGAATEVGRLYGVSEAASFAEGSV